MKTKILTIIGLFGLLVSMHATEWKVRQAKVPGGTISYTVSGTTCTITAEPDADYKFVRWLDDENATQTRNIDFSTQDINSPAMVFRAAFAYIPATEMTEGPVTVDVQNANIPSYSLTVTPTAPANHPFSHWNNGKREATIIYTEQEGLVIPRFSGMSVNAPLAVGGKVTYSYIGNLYELRAIPNEDYIFQQWTDNVTTNPRVVNISELQDGSASFRAVFVHQPSVHFDRGDVEVTVKEESPLLFNLALTQCDIETFACWSNASLDDNIDYVEADGNVIPHFLKALPENTPALGGHIEVETLKCGYKLTAVADNGYSFSKWEDESTDPIREVDLASSDYKAFFVNAAYQVGDQFFGELSDAIEASNNDNPVILWLDKDDDASIDKEVSINGGGHQVGDLTILNGAKLHMTSALKINDLYLNTTTGSSSQLTGESDLIFNNAFIDITLEAGKDVASPDLWYAFAVPFEVSIPNGIHRASAPNVGPLVSGEDFLIWEYDGQMRADNKDNGWKIIESGTLYPGRFYMIGIGGTDNVWRFTKANNDVLSPQNQLDMHAFTGSSVLHNGWNAVANSTFTYADAATTNGVLIAQVYKNGALDANYQVKNLEESSFVVASPFFIQTAREDNLTLSPASHSALYAPKHDGNHPSYYKLQLMKDDEQKDVIYLTASEYATEEYTIGKDVAKMMGGNSNSYLYIPAYGAKLCAYDMLLMNNTAYCPLGIYAPQADSYILSASHFGDDDVWLTENGEPIWNLSDSDYPLFLAKGTTSTYGLLIYQGAAQVPTGNETISTSSNALKYIQDGCLFIRANGCTYDAQGKLK